MINYITISGYRKIFDRIKISAPMSSYEKFLSVLRINAKILSLTKSKQKTFFIENYERNNLLIQIIKPIQYEQENSINQRFYIQLLQPDNETQKYIKDLLRLTIPKFMYKQFNPCLSEIEIACDFFTDTNTVKYSPYLLHEYFSKHLVLKFSRKGSVENFNDQTMYLGKNGYVWKGDVGCRCYIKSLPEVNNGADFCRFEQQLNRKYLRENSITVDDLPLKLDDFHIIDKFEVLDDFSANKIRNITRTIMRKTGSKYYNDTKSFRFKIKEQLLRSQIYGAFIKDDYVSVPEQIERCNEIKKKHGLTLNPKKHCQRLFTIQEIVSGIQ